MNSTQQGPGAAAGGYTGVSTDTEAAAAATAGGTGTDINATDSLGGRGGLAVPAEFVFQAIYGNDYTREKYLASGSGGRAWRTGTGGDGGDSGGGVAAAVNWLNLTETTSRTLTGG